MAKKNIVRFGDWISGGWNLFVAQWQVWSLMGLTLFLPIAILAVVAYVLFFVQIYSAGTTQKSFEEFLTVFGASIVLFLGLLLAWISFIAAGMYRAAFKQLEGQTITYSDVWSGGPWTGTMILTMFLSTLLIAIGAILCYIPGVIVGGLLYLAPPIVVRQNLSAVSAMQKSYEVTSQDWIMFAIFAFVVNLIAQLGVYACYIGMIFTLPLSYTIAAVAYRDCFEPVTSENVAIVQTKSCRVCGRPISAAANFCDQCGAGQT